MKNYVTNQNVIALIRIAVLCLLAFLSVSSPAFAAMLSHRTDASATLSVLRSMIYPLCATKYCLPLFAACACGSMAQISCPF